MARETIITLVDDLDGGPADETVVFSLDGATYEIDLSAENASRLRMLIKTYVAAARDPNQPKIARRGRGRSSARRRT